MLNIILFVMIGIIIEAPVWYWITLGVVCAIKVFLWIFSATVKSIAEAIKEHLD